MKILLLHQLRGVVGIRFDDPAMKSAIRDADVVVVELPGSRMPRVWKGGGVAGGVSVAVARYEGAGDDPGWRVTSALDESDLPVHAALSMSDPSSIERRVRQAMNDSGSAGPISRAIAQALWPLCVALVAVAESIVDRRTGVDR